MAYEDDRKRYLIALGASIYEHEDFPDLDSVPNDIARVSELFVDKLKYQRVLEDIALNTSAALIRKKVSDWFASTERSADEIVVFYFSGHGGPNKLGRHYLWPSNADPNNAANTAIKASDLIDWFFEGENPRPENIWVILDTCHSGQGGGEIAADSATRIYPIFNESQSGLWALSTASPKDEAEQHAFVDAFIHALEQALSDEAFAGKNQKYIQPSSLVSIINRYFGDHDIPQTTQQNSVAQSDEPPFLINPHYVEGYRGVNLEDAEENARNAYRHEDMAAHWDPKARGVEISTETGQYFSGRQAALHELVFWLNAEQSDNRMRVVTGDPGSGKSAVLARLVVSEATDIIDAAIHAHGLTLTQITIALAEMIDITADDPTNLVEGLMQHNDTVRIVVDALDESAEPSEIARKLLKPLAAISAVRLIVGTRRSELQRLGDARVDIDLDKSKYFDQQDIENYVKQRLLETANTPYHDADQVNIVAAAVAEKAQHSFLVARIVSRRLIGSEAIDIKKAGWREQLPSSRDDAFAQDLERFGDDEQKIRDLLIPLAYAEGRGLPQENIWANIASRIAGCNYNNGDINWLKRKASFYITPDRESGVAVYRLFHESFAEYLRDDEQESFIQECISDCLIEQVIQKSTDGQLRWDNARPYICHYLATHAATTGRLDELIIDPLYLIHAEPVCLTAALPKTKTIKARVASQVFQLAQHRFQNDTPISIKAAHLELTAREQGANDFADSVQKLFQTPWYAIWARAKPLDSNRIVGEHQDWVWSVDIGNVENQLVVVSGSNDHTVRLWDAQHGKLERIFKGHNNPVLSVALGSIQDRAVIVSGSEDCTIRLWDVQSGALKHILKGHDEAILSVAISDIDGKAMIASSSYDCTVRLWDASSGVLKHVLRGHEDGIRSVLIADVYGQPVIVSGSYDCTVRLWNAQNGKLERIFRGHEDAVLSIAVGHFEGRMIVISSSYDCTIRLWDIQSGSVRCVFQDYDELLWSIAFGVSNGKQIIAAASFDRTIRLWDLQSKLLKHTLHGHLNSVWSVVIKDINNRMVIASGSGDRTIRVWDFENKLPRYTSEIHEDGVISLALSNVKEGQNIIASGSIDNTVKLWDMRDGELLNTFRGHEREVSSVVIGHIDGQTVIASNSLDRTMMLWNLQSKMLISNFEIPKDPIRLSGINNIEDQIVMASEGEDHAVLLFNMQNGKIISRLVGHKDRVRSAAINFVNRKALIVSGSEDGTVKLWDIKNNVLKHTFYGHRDWVTSVALGRIDEQSVIVSGCVDHTIRLWNAENGMLVHELEAHENGISTVILGNLYNQMVIISCGYDRTVRLWDAKRGELLKTIHFGSTVYTTILGDNGNLVTGTSQGVLMLKLTPSIFD